MKSKNISLKLSILYLFAYLCMGSFYPFLATCFKAKGLSFTQIGIALAANSIFAVAFGPVWGYISDKYISKKKSLLIIAFISAFLILIFTAANSFISVLFSVIIMTIVICNMGPILDAFTYDVIDSYSNIQYGRMRFMGSLGYGLATLIIGYTIKYFGINSDYIAYLIFGILTVIIICSIKINVNKKNDNNKINEHVTLANVKQIITKKSFSIFILSVMIINIGMSSFGNYINEAINKTGGDVSNLGIVWFIICLCQIPVFFIGNIIIRKFNISALYCFAAFIYGMRFFATSLCSNYIFVILIQFTELISYPFYLLASLEYINKIVPAKMRSTGIALFNSIGIGFGSFIGNMTGSIIIQNSGVFKLYKIDSLMCFVALIIGFIILHPMKKPGEN